MISGFVTGDRQAVIRVTVRGPAGQEQEIDAIIELVLTAASGATWVGVGGATPTRADG